MNNKKLIGLAIASAVTVGVAMSANIAVAGSKGKMEKAYCIAKAGHNDCGGKTTGHSCQGQSKKTGVNASNEWILLPRGICSKIVNCSTTAGKCADEEKA